MYLRILVVSFWMLVLISPAPAQKNRRKPRPPRPEPAAIQPPVGEISPNSISLRQNEPKGWVWVSQTIDLAKQLGGDENIMTLDGEPPPSMLKPRITLGLVIDDEGHIVTRLFDVSPNDPPNDVKAYATGTKPFPAKFLGMDAVSGFCVLKVEGAKFQPAPIAERVTLPLRQNIRLYGFHPNLRQNTVPVMSQDRPRRLPFPGQIAKAVSDFRFNSNNPIYYLLSPKLTPVQDCSLILEKDDSVFGVAIYDIGSEDPHLVYPISRVQSIAKAVIKSHKSLSYGWLGITDVVNVPPVIQTPLTSQPPPEPGVRITAIVPDSPAHLAGVKRQDILLGINERRIESREQLSTALRQLPPDCEITLKIKRGNEYKILKAKLVPAPATDPDGQFIEIARKYEEMKQELNNLPQTDPDREKKTQAVNMMNDFLFQIKSPARPEIRLRVFYGFEIQTLTGQLMNYFGVTNGVLVSSVVEKNKAATAGLQAGDVIIKIGDKAVTNLATLLSALDGATTKSVDITVSRQRETKTISFSR